MGARLSGSLAGAFAAVLLAGSPTFLFEIVSPTSDVPCTAWWALSLALLLYEGRGAAFAAGLSAGLAILTRPNVLLLVPPVRRGPRCGFGVAGRSRALSNNRCARGERTCGVRDVECHGPCDVVCRGIGSLLHCGRPPQQQPLRIAVLFWIRALRRLYKWSHLLSNLARYPGWLLETETPIVLLGLAAPFVLRARAPATDLPRSPRWVATVWLCFVAAVFASYLFYLPFEEWWYVRFLMPAYPPLLVLTSAVLVALLAPLSRALRGGGELAAAVIVAVVAWRCASFSIERGAHMQWKAEQRYATVGNYVASKLPDRAVLLSMQHSGGIRHYSGRLTVRYDLIEPADLDRCRILSCEASTTRPLSPWRNGKSRCSASASRDTVRWRRSTGYRWPSCIRIEVRIVRSGRPSAGAARSAARSGRRSMKLLHNDGGMRHVQCRR